MTTDEKARLKTLITHYSAFAYEEGKGNAHGGRLSFEAQQVWQEISTIIDKQGDGEPIDHGYDNLSEQGLPA